ncbi:hypothetical protein C440_07497 [Haloferax mucosum ATCC BAA-1512]|uniref:Uncharacterized protein n=1 Tax=Haloferax mucosum ATCC BAA-1512 TaxID=662479 RepID=M0IFQ9_9EURY|nr:hypothetical protein [Haloferax mucosum]ELZ94902.1 hypothetical protein C440_07497 [Haloferax mucosum ATCC BAA-1512]
MSEDDTTRQTPPSPGDTFVRDAGVPNAGVVAPNHAAAEGAPEVDTGETESNSSGGFFASLFDSSATGPTVDQLAKEYPDLPRWSRYHLRMLIRVSGGDGTPPVVDGFVGTLLFGLPVISSMRQDENTDESSQDEEEADDDPAALAAAGV